MLTLMINPDDGGAMAGVPIHGRQPKRVLEHLEEEIPEAGDPCLYEGRRPCILFGMRHYAEDWSGEHVRELHPFRLIGAQKLRVPEFWALVRKTHGPKVQWR
jgi:hypothetical protein